jgi:hypothetical protein
MLWHLSNKFIQSLNRFRCKSIVMSSTNNRHYVWLWNHLCHRWRVKKHHCSLCLWKSHTQQDLG